MKVNWKEFLIKIVTFFTIVMSYISISVNAENVESSKSTVKMLSPKLENCHVDGIRQQVKCATLSVPENYTKTEGKKININVLVLPAIDNSQETTPLMFLAGGPGQAATELAPMLYKRFNEIRKTRDLILIDQRGTGKSHPLECTEVQELNPYSLTPEQLNITDVKACIKQFNGDLSQFNSENAIRDFDAVRAALGYKQVHIYGGSYGTRAGLVYMRLFPQSLKSVVLDSVGPIEVPIGLFGQSAAQSFNKIIQHCQAYTSCAKQYPNLAAEFTAVKERLKKQPFHTTIAHPRLGTDTEFVISHDKFLQNIQMQLYSQETRSLVPLTIHQAYLGNYKPIAGMIAQTEESMGIYLGLHFNIVCNEDLPKITEQMKTEDANNNFAGGMALASVEKVCAVWPRYQISNNFYQTVTADIPTLILSGALDPVTPPSNGDITDSHLPNSHHIISKTNAHIVASSRCGIDIINEFLTHQQVDKLDSACLDELPDETFMLGLNDGSDVKHATDNKNSNKE